MAKRPSDREALDRLSQDLSAFEARRVRKAAVVSDEASGLAYRLIGELVGGVLGGLGLGWLVDQYAHTGVWGRLAGVLLGAAVGVFLVVKTAAGMSASAQTKAGPAKSVPFDEDEED